MRIKELSSGGGALDCLDGSLAWDLSRALARFIELETKIEIGTCLSWKDIVQHPRLGRPLLKRSANPKLNQPSEGLEPWCDSFQYQRNE